MLSLIILFAVAVIAAMAGAVTIGMATWKIEGMFGGGILVFLIVFFGGVWLLDLG